VVSPKFMIDGDYFEWDSIEKKLKRSGTIKVVLKKLGNNVPPCNQKKEKYFLLGYTQ
jgi:hypothetical protein